MVIKPAVLASALLAASPALAQAPVQNRANAAVASVPSVLLAGAAAQPDLCTGVVSAAYGSPLLGVTVDLQHVDKACARIRKAKALQLFGYGAAAVQVMCGDPEVRAAMARAGTPCDRVKEQP